MQVLGRQATRNVVDVSDDQAKLLINGGNRVSTSRPTTGSFCIRWRGFVAGVGFYKRPVLKSQIPRFRPVE